MESPASTCIAGENDHDAVKKVGKTLAQKVTTIPCMVDRICTGRQIGEREINVVTEPAFEGSLVLLNPPADPDLVPFAGDPVVSTIPRDTRPARARPGGPCLTEGAKVRFVAQGKWRCLRALAYTASLPARLVRTPLELSPRPGSCCPPATRKRATSTSGSSAL